MAWRVVAARLALVAFGLAAAPTMAGAQGLSARIEPSYRYTSTRQTDQVGTTTETDSDTISQRYRLNWDKLFGPELRLSTGAVLEDVRTWTSGDLEQFSGATTSLLFANTAIGSSLLGGGAGYDRRRIDAHPGRQPALLSETLRVSGAWRPLGLPELDLQASRTNRFDEDRAGQDSTIQTLSTGLRYLPWRELELRYGFRMTETENHLTGAGVRDLGQSARATYSDQFLSNRLSVYSSYAIDHARSRLIGGGAGEILTQQFPVAALSAIEQLPATPERITLQVNPSLLGQATGAPVNIGFAPSLGGDVANRHLGVQFGDAFTTVNRFFVYVDTPLPPELQAAYGWSAYRSEDNLEWTPVPIVGPVSYDPFENRFEIPLANTRAPYLKVVVRPLPVGVTTDPTFQSVRVNRLQVFFAELAGSVDRESSRTGGAFSASVGYRILQVPALHYDSSVFVRHGRELSDSTYVLLNTLSAGQQLTRVFRVSAQAQRSDDNQSDGHAVGYRYGTTLFADVLPTLSGSIAYSGSSGTIGGVDRRVDAVSALARAELYQGIDLFATAARSYSSSELEGSADSTNVNAGTTLVPHARLTLTGNYSLTATSSRTGFRRTQRVEGSSMFNPVGTLSLTFGVSRTFAGEQQNTLVNGSAAWSPLPGGALQLSLAYTQSLETASDSVQQFGSATARWSIRRGTFLDVGYSITDTEAPTGETLSRAFSAGLIISI